MDYATRTLLQNYSDIDINKSIMGAVCSPEKEELSNYRSTDPKPQTEVNNKEVCLLFTCDSLDNVKSEGLILFVDRHKNLEMNEFLRKVDKKVGFRLQEHLNNMINQSDPCRLDSLLLNINMKQLNSTKVVVICVEVWKGKQISQYSGLQRQIEEGFDLLYNEKVSSVCLTNFNSELGIPQSFGNKTIASAVSAKISKFKQIVLAFTNEEQIDLLSQLFASPKVTDDGNLVFNCQMRNLPSEIVQSEYY